MAGRLQSQISSAHTLQRASPESILPMAALAYEAALEPRKWKDFLQRFGEYLQSPACLLWAHDFSTHTSDLQGIQEGLGINLGVDASALQSFHDYYCHTNVWLKNPQLHRSGTVVHSSALYSDAQLPKTEWYGDWLRHQDLFYSCAAVVERAEDRSFNLTVLRSRRVGAYSAQELQWVEQLIPHLKTALALHTKLHHTQALASASVTLLDSLPLGVVLLGSQSDVLHANHRAEQLMQQTQLLHIKARRVHAVQASVQQWLEQAIGESLSISQGMTRPDGVGWHSYGPVLHGQRGHRLQQINGQHLHLMVAPMPSHSEPYGLRCGAVLILSEPGRIWASLTQALQTYYQMTLSESKLVQALINGLSPQEYADQAGLSIHTVRSHFKNAAAKAGVSRQSDLVRTVLMGPALLQWQSASVA